MNKKLLVATVVIWSLVLACGSAIGVVVLNDDEPGDDDRTSHARRPHVDV